MTAKSKESILVYVLVSIFGLGSSLTGGLFAAARSLPRSSPRSRWAWRRKRPISSTSAKLWTRSANRPRKPTSPATHP